MTFLIMLSIDSSIISILKTYTDQIIGYQHYWPILAVTGIACKTYFLLLSLLSMNEEILPRYEYCEQLV